ncbi:MAG: hypothetical protein L3J66_14340 [Bacteroidales bacterium]|nr:hypothetical protein [Bacteroidales bacterium]
MKRKILSLFTSILFLSVVQGQDLYLPLNRDYNFELQKAVYSSAYRFHTSIQPWQRNELEQAFNYDSIAQLNRLRKKIPKKWKQKAWDKFLNDNVVALHRPDFDVVLNPLMNFSMGRETNEEKSTWVNTRGFEVKGRIGRGFTFYSSFYENQAVFANYLDTYIRSVRVVPGQGKVRGFKGGGFDFASATGYIAFHAEKYFSIQLGHGKNFLGDGYRSLLLSDNAFNNLFLKATLNFWNIKYTVLYNQYIDINENIPDVGYARKYSTVHYLSWAISKRVNLSFFDVIVWQTTDSLGNYRGFDLQYLNPVIFLRPVEFSTGSPDNALLGLNLSVIVGRHNVFYGQLILDEFKLEEVTAGNGWWGNKQGFQLGFKTYDPFRLKGLYFQTEYNWVRPYTYSQSLPLKNYGHYNQPLAHPMGANFWEWVSIVNYNIKRFYFRYEFQYALYGLDYDGKNFGKNIYKPYTTRENEYGNYVGQGLETTVLYNDISVSYLINPAYNFNIALGYTNRSSANDKETVNTSYIYIALRTSLRNFYYDF